MDQQAVGRVIKYFQKAGVAAVALSGRVAVGDRLRFAGVTTDFEMVVASMQIDNAAVDSAEAGQSVGLKVPERVREHDTLFRLEE